MDVFAGNEIEVTQATDEKKAARNAKRNAERDKALGILKQSIAEDPSLKERFNKYSGSIEVTKAFAFDGKGYSNIEKAKDWTKDAKKFVQIPNNIGYLVKNNTKEDIKYTKMVYSPAKNEEGKTIYEGKRQELVWKPGEEIMLSREDFTLLCVMPEISFELANGKLVRSSKSKTPKGIEDELSKYYFRANPESGISVNSDKFKVVIGSDTDGIKDKKYLSTFGYVLNPTTKAAKERVKKTATSSQLLYANMLRRMIDNNENNM